MEGTEDDQVWRTGGCDSILTENRGDATAVGVLGQSNASPKDFFNDGFLIMSEWWTRLELPGPGLRVRDDTRAAPRGRNQ